MELRAAVVDVFEHIKAGGSGRHKDDGSDGRGNEGFSVLAGEADGGLEVGGEGVEFGGEERSEGTTGFADQDEVAEVGRGGEQTGEVGEVLVVGFVATAGDEDEGLFREGGEGDLGGGEVGGEIVVVVFDAVEIAEILEAVRQALPGQGEFLARVQIMQAPEAQQAKVEALLERMVQENGRADRYTAPMLGAMLHELLLACSRVCTVLQDVPEQIHTTDREIVRAARFITEHYAEPITAADIAAAAGFSPNYLSRKFREAAGFGVHEYLTFIRLRNAAHELTATGDSITDIALRSGFSNSNYFKDAFKKQYGCTPRDYRRKTR